MCSAQAHVRFTPESDIECDIMECPLWANSGHVALGLTTLIFSPADPPFADP